MSRLANRVAIVTLDQGHFGFWQNGRMALAMEARLVNRRSIVVAAAAFLAMGGPRRAMAENPVLVPVHQLIDGLLEVMKAGGTRPFSQRFDMLAPVIDETFDLTAILRASVGPGAWQPLSPEQQEMLTKAFRRYTIASYVSSFDGFNGQRFTVNPETRTVGNEQVVQTQIIPLAGDKHDLDYVMREGSAGWRIVDVLADGAVSRVAVQRSDFRQLMKRSGASGLSQNLDAKSASLSG
jgi:phospholipid transport system substrate-binding protein